MIGLESRECVSAFLDEIKALIKECRLLMVAGTSVLAALSVLLHVPLSFEPPMTDEYMVFLELMDAKTP